MNAIVKNKAESELLKLIEEVANLLEFELEIEFEALKEGGIKDVIKFLNKKKNRPYVIYFAGIISGIIINVGSDFLNKDRELDDLTKQEKILNIRVLKNQLEKDSIEKANAEKIVDTLITEISDTYKVQVYKSRYYKTIEKEQKVYQISTDELNDDNESLKKEKIIFRKDFEKQILIDEDTKPITLENVNIQIVAPVLSQSNIKWKGIFDGKYLGFYMLDSDFKNDVLNKKYSFTNGTNIKCNLRVIYSLSENGEIIIKDAKVIDVLEVFDGSLNHITKKSKHIAELKNQLKFDFPQE